MPQNYYQNATTVATVPLQIEPILAYLQPYICQNILYKNEPYTRSQNRFFLGNISMDQASRYNIAGFSKTNLELPFTVFKPGQVTPWEGMQSHNAKSMTIYDPRYGCYISSIPVQVDIIMMSMFATGADHERAKKMLIKKQRSMFKLWIPIVVNGVSDFFCVQVEMKSIENGEYAYDFAQWMSTNKIFDILHTMTVKFFDIITDATLVHPVDTMLVNFSSYLESPNNPIYEQTLMPVPDDLKITTTAPVANATGVSRTAPIVINFNTPVMYSGFADYFSSVPYVDDWVVAMNGAGTQVTLTPVTPLTANKLYNITVSKDIINANLKPLDGYQDYTFSFTTGA